MLLLSLQKTGEVTDIVEFVGLVSDITQESIRNIGGIVARIGINKTQYLNVYACINTGTIYKAENSGGIIGIIANRTNVYNCYNNGKVYNSYNSSGIIGNVNGLCTINNCLNTGSINTLQSQAPRYIGAIIGKAVSVGNIQDSANSVYLNTSLSYEGNVYDSIIETFSKEIKERGCVGSIAEIYDSVKPYSPKGTISQAWSVAEILRILT